MIHPKSLIRFLALAMGCWMMAAHAKPMENRLEPPVFRMQDIQSAESWDRMLSQGRFRSGIPIRTQRLADLSAEQREQMRQQMRQHWQQSLPEQREANRKQRQGQPAEGLLPVREIRRQQDWRQSSHDGRNKGGRGQP